MAQAQKPDLVFRAKRTSPFKSAGTSVQSTTGSRGVSISGGNAGYTMFPGSVKGTGYPLHSPVSLSLPLPCVTVCHHISTGVYHNWYHIQKAVEKSNSASAWGLALSGIQPRLYVLPADDQKILFELSHSPNTRFKPLSCLVFKGNSSSLSGVNSLHCHWHGKR